MTRALAMSISTVALIALVACSGTNRSTTDAASIAEADKAGRLATPYPIEPFGAIDIDGQDRSFSTWKGRVVILNVWATWCPPCRREIPALAALQDKYRDRVLVIGLLQEDITTEFARAFGKSTGINYPVVRSTFEIESRFPKILALPTTFIMDPAGRLVAMYAEEINALQVERELVRLLQKSFVARVPQEPRLPSPHRLPQ